MYVHCGPFAKRRSILTGREVSDRQWFHHMRINRQAEVPAMAKRQIDAVVRPARHDQPADVALVGGTPGLLTEDTYIRALNAPFDQETTSTLGAPVRDLMT